MKTSFSAVRNYALAFLALAAVAPGASADSLVLPPTYPDLTVFGASITYISTCQGLDKNGNIVVGSNGRCGTTSGSGNSVRNFTGDQLSGVLTITGTSSNNMTLNIEGTGSILVSAGSLGKSYTLTAQFDATGQFVASGSTISAYGVTTDPDYMSGTLLTANLTTFGYSGSGAAGTFYYTFDSNVAGDFAMEYYNNPYSGVIASTTNMTTMATTKPVTPGWTSGTWDPTNPTDGIDSGGFFTKRSFTATSNVDTFVPLPASAWLFASGLLGLVSISRRKNAARV